MLPYGHFGAALTADRLDKYAQKIEAWVTAVEEKRVEPADDEVAIEYFFETVETPDIWGEHKARGEVAMKPRGVLVALDR